MNKVLLIGPIPPPIGGVSIHFQRLLESLKRDNLTFEVVNTTKFNFLMFFYLIFNIKIIHLHTSNIFFQFFLSIFSFLFNKRLIVTFHGDIDRYGFFKSSIIYLSLKLCKIPIVLNNKNYVKARLINSRTNLISAFIPPTISKNIIFDQELENKINKYQRIFCTNAFNISYDKNNNEIYQIFTLVDVFKSFPQYLLVISDPSGAYKKEIKKKNNLIPINIYFISYEHEFYKVILQSDCLIRFTTTDGDSLSIREALFLNKMVIASNVIDRPDEVITVDLNKKDLIDLIDNLNFRVQYSKSSLDTVESIVKLYK